MDRQKVYIIVIILCFIGTAGVLYWANSGGDVSELQPLGSAAKPILNEIDAGLPQEAQALNNIPVPDATTKYIAPRVFPLNPKLETRVFKSSEYTALTDYTPLNVTPEEMGRDNPYKSY
ncbi:MAG: hypothetical protein KW793_02810 [Candidatus Doudnabacteria bacterium]|nr:hypothetical protein [Candidatus Doudnabacteria bacterium]